VTTALTSAVELLERSLGYTRMALAGAARADLAAPTPCREWRLRDLLSHMDDSLDAFIEAAGGRVALTPAGATPGVAVLQQKACALLGVWSGAGPPGVSVGKVDLATDLLVATAALEVTVHGWDVAQATGARTPIPDQLAHDLLPVARRTVTEDDRGVRFAPALPEPIGAGADARLLAYLGRDSIGPKAKS
jgi:uncharacterized protein (TIGR03086 family)